MKRAIQRALAQQDIPRKSCQSNGSSPGCSPSTRPASQSDSNHVGSADTAGAIGAPGTAVACT